MRKGDDMKLKTWHLFAFIIILFMGTFFVINQKFDKFYRVNGINNDNRVLIEKYLDEEEQTYLIDNQIQIDLFIDYIKNDEFILQNYQYYNLLKNSGHYKKENDIINIGNNLSTRLTYLFSNRALLYAEELVSLSLENAFLSERNFSFSYINLYVSIRDLYKNHDYSYVNDIDKYVQLLNEQGVTEIADIENIFSQLSQSYTQSSIKKLLNEEVAADVKKVYNPYELSTVVNDHNYVGYYEPKGLLLIQDVPRVQYAMYLQSDAYNALLNMYNDLKKEYKYFLLRDAYHSLKSLNKKDIGYDEFQLGLSICVSQSETAYNDFENTKLSQWLQDHAYEYGFILRYPKNKASITNHTYDAHIYRYVGKSLAQSLYTSDLTLEEYLNIEE